MQRVSIIGLGWLGLPLAYSLQQKGYKAKGSTTSFEKQQKLQADGVDAYLLALNPQPEGNMERLLNTDILVVNVPPKAGMLGDEFHPAQMQHLSEAVSRSTVRWVIYVSSTSVYPELNRVVTEDDVQTPEQSIAPNFVRAEQIWQGLQTDQLQVTILRCGGLIGYERQPGKYVAGRTVDTGAIPVNYIHRDDAVGMIEAVIEQELTGVFNVVAPLHPVREEVYKASCQKYGYTLPQFVASDKDISYKIVSSEKLVQATNYSFLKPDPLLF